MFQRGPHNVLYAPSGKLAAHLHLIELIMTLAVMQGVKSFELMFRIVSGIICRVCYLQGLQLPFRCDFWNRTCTRRRAFK